MSSIVLDLQIEVTNPDCDIVNVLRKAHLIAVKLGLTEFDKWISCELNGYNSNDAIPNYREVKGELKAFNPYRGWIPVLIPSSKMEETICKHKVSNSISEIKNLYEKSENGIVLALTGEMQALLNRATDAPLGTHYRIELSTTAIGDIVEKVKNSVLEWTIKLEAEGILGEGMQFSTIEKETAKRIPQTIHNYFGNTSIINAPVDHSAVVVGDDNAVEYSYEKAEEIASEVEKALESEELTAEDKETAMEMLDEIREKISQQKKPSVIKAALIGLKDFLISAGASAAVALIQAKMQGMF